MKTHIRSQASSRSHFQNNMAPRCGVVKIILGIACMIVFVQVLTIYHFSVRYTDQTETRGRRDEGFFKYEEEDQDYWTLKKDLESMYKDPSAPSTPDYSEAIHCELKHKDAHSALRRAKTQKCKDEIYRIACLSESGKLYWDNITRLCPIDRSKGRPSHSIEPKAGYGPPIRILYAMVVHGRAFRQVKRLFKALFHTNHYFLFHVDSRSDYLHKEVQQLASQFNNVAVTPWRMATIWGGASLLKMLLRLMSDALELKSWKWDFFINLSASCFPVQTNEKLSSFLRAHREENFLKPHGGSVERFVRKQGIARTFYECDEHMWRLGERKLPATIDFDGGSDWIALNRKFVSYVVNSEDTLVLGLKNLYSYALLPAESFFHSVLRNSPYCETYAKGNLRLTNWKRKLGCRCQYKHIVDWCGCSPNDFKVEDFVRLKSQTVNHFARKFEPIINQEIINLLDEWLYGDFPSDMPGRSSYWENFYYSKTDKIEKFDIYMTFLQSFARVSANSLSLSSGCRFSPIWKPTEAFYFMQKDKLHGILTTYNVKIATDDIRREMIFLETYFKPKNMMFLYNGNLTEPGSRLKGLSVGTSWDQKERVFRNIAGLIGPYDSPTLVHRWVHGEEFHVRIVWQDPLNQIAGMYQMKVEKNWVISFHKPTFNKPLRPGTWTVKIIYNDDFVLGLVKFLIIPRAYFQGSAATVEKVAPANNGPPAGLYSSDFVIEFDRDANDTQDKVSEFSEFSSSVGSKLDSWVDKHVMRHWQLQESCAISPTAFKKCGGIQSCRKAEWSTHSPDPKTEIGNVKENGSLR